MANNREEEAREAALELLCGEKVGGGDGCTYVMRTPSIEQLAAALLAFADRTNGAEAMRELEALATPGEWWVAEGSEEDGSIYIDAAENGERPVAMIMSGSPHNQDRADADFIVAAITYVRAAIRSLSIHDTEGGRGDGPRA